jgi:hypothetical protein
LSTPVVSHRLTTSSRHPGKAIQGSVRFEASGIVKCPDCGFMRMRSLHPHATRYDAQGVVRDCAGREVRR